MRATATLARPAAAKLFSRCSLSCSFSRSRRGRSASSSARNSATNLSDSAPSLKADRSLSNFSAASAASLWAAVSFGPTNASTSGEVCFSSAPRDRITSRYLSRAAPCARSALLERRASAKPTASGPSSEKDAASLRTRPAKAAGATGWPTTANGLAESQRAWKWSSQRLTNCGANAEELPSQPGTSMGPGAGSNRTSREEKSSRSRSPLLVPSTKSAMRRSRWTFATFPSSDSGRWGQSRTRKVMSPNDALEEVLTTSADAGPETRSPALRRPALANSKRARRSSIVSCCSCLVTL
mmetsp:Transcript_1763/g.4134  ORF Transcript_1763/g.4134 Transcript_1763/m.4134 type:complete len:297 (+) Transcript_1763:1-891(+)